MESFDIRCSDYRELLSSISDKSIGLVLTDPPYGISYQNQYTHKKFEKLASDDKFFSYEILAKESNRVLKNDTAFFAFTGWSEYPRHFNDVNNGGLTVREPLIVRKRCGGVGSGSFYGTFQPNADWIIFATKGKFRFRRTKLCRNEKAGQIPALGRKPTPEFKFRFPACWFSENLPFSSENPSWRNANKIEHPTVKSRRFCEWIIQMCTDEGDIVLDPFLGSGTTAVACRNLNRQFIGCDVEQKFIDLTLRRLRDDV